MKTFTFTLRLKGCPHCGQSLPINGPALQASCNSCHKELPLSTELWASQIESISRKRALVGNPYACSRAEEQRPACPACSAHFDLDPTWIGKDIDVPCPHCGHAVPTFPPPAWLKEELPTVVQLVGADRPGERGEALPLAPNEEAGRPVVLNCPHCAAGLKVTAENERTIACEHCGTDVYLPDGVWQRLHPVHTTHLWAMVYNGGLRSAESIRAEEGWARSERKRREREREKEQRQKARNRRGQLIALAALVATVAGVLFLWFVVLG